MIIMDYDKLSTKDLIKEYKNSKRKLNSKVKVEYKYLKKYYGLAYFDQNRIEIDKKLEGKKRFLVELHETLHIAMGPSVSERQINRYERIIGNTLWEIGYRLKNDKNS